MKRKILKISAIMLAIAMLCACGSNSESPGTKSQQAVTKPEAGLPASEPESVPEEQVKRINAGALKIFNYYPGYDNSDGSSHSVCLKKKNGKWVVDCYDKEGENDPTDVYYEVSDEDVAAFEDFVKDERFADFGRHSKSGDCPEGYSEWTYSMSFANPYSELGDDVNVYFSEFRQYSDEDRELIEELGRRLEALKGHVTGDESQNNKSEDKGEHLYLFDTSEDVLHAYKEAQDGKYTEEQINELLGYGEALLDYGWPSNDTDGDVGYVYYDINSDGEEELIITYQEQIMDIYGHYCGKLSRFFSGGSDVTATLYPDGILKTEHGLDPQYRSVLWSVYDEGFGYFCTTIRKESDKETGDYYSTTSYYGLSDDLHKEIEEDLKNGGLIPVWMDEIEDELTKSEYEKLIPKTEPIKLPKSLAISNMSEETIPEYLIYVEAPDGYANLRTGPGTEYDVICQIPNGGELEVYREDATSTNGKKWIKVAYYREADNEDGYEWLTGWIAESQLEE